jgi:hypothetical protein
MSEPHDPTRRKYWRHYTKFSDGTTLRRIYPYPEGSPHERSTDMEPVFEVWRDAEDNVIECPDTELYRIELELLERAKAGRARWIPEGALKDKETQRWKELQRLSAEDKERAKREAERSKAERANKWLKEKGLTVEEHQRYRAALKEYEETKLWSRDAVRKPLPEDFKGSTDPNA